MTAIAARVHAAALTLHLTPAAAHAVAAAAAAHDWRAVRRTLITEHRTDADRALRNAYYNRETNA